MATKQPITPNGQFARKTATVATANGTVSRRLQASSLAPNLGKPIVPHEATFYQ